MDELVTPLSVYDVTRNLHEKIDALIAEEESTPDLDDRVGARYRLFAAEREFGIWIHAHPELWR